MLFLTNLVNKFQIGNVILKLKTNSVSFRLHVHSPFLNSRATRANLLLLLFLKEQQEQNEQIALFTFSNSRAICFFIKDRFVLFNSGLCSFLRRKLITRLLSHFLASLFRSYCPWQKDQRERFTLLKRAQEQFTLFVKI